MGASSVASAAQPSRVLTALVVFLLLAGCSAYAPLTDAPPSADHPWKGPGLERASAALAAPDHAREPEPVPIDAQKAYELSELIDIADRTNPHTRSPSHLAA